MSIKCPILSQDTVHIWQIHLPDLFHHIPTLLPLLSHDEKERANRFKFDIHRNRFIVTRATLRKTLSLYLSLAPEKIHFHYGEKGKPFIRKSNITFNVSHSEDIALIGIALHNEIGIDIEKIQHENKQDIAKRFFTEAEFSLLKKYPEKENFYKIWVKKEAIIKALGSGLHTSLNHFSVTLQKDAEKVLIEDSNTSKACYVSLLSVDSSYQGALATERSICHIQYMNFPGTE